MAMASRMACQMTVTEQRCPDEDPETPNLLSLPTEVLVKIMLLLPAEMLDRMRLRYVSRRLRSISETPSMWRKLVWPNCDRREENCLRNVLKICGVHIRRLSFPHHVIGPLGLQSEIIQLKIEFEFNKTILKLVETSEVLKILQCCGNVTHLSLPALDHSTSSCDPGHDLKKVIQKMKHLTSLNVHCRGSFRPYLTLTVPLKELTIYAVICSSWGPLAKPLHRKEDFKRSIEKWVTIGFSPQNLNIILDSSWYSAQIFYREFLLASWTRWNSKIPVGHVACLKLYSSYKTPLNLFHNAPVFQLQFGKTATLPFVQPGSIDEWLLLTDHDDGSRKATICIRRQNTSLLSRMYEIIEDHGICDQGNNSMTNLTELDLSNYKLDCTKLVMTFPMLQRLNIRDNENLRIEDLQVISTCCFNLQGLNISIRSVDVCMKMWEILSGMKLTYLRMDGPLIEYPSRLDDAKVDHFIALFQQCITLRALELCNFSILFDNYKLLSYFPSLEYCRLNDYEQSICVQDILTTCKKLRCFNYNYSHDYKPQPPLVSAYNNNLQQLCIFSTRTDLHDTFMDTVSAHGGLIHVVFLVQSVSSEGITTLIRNSPNLLTFRLYEREKHISSYTLDLGSYYYRSLSASLSEKFAGRKLFTSGLFSIVQQEHNYLVYLHTDTCYDSTYDDFDKWLQNTDLLSLWPPNPFCDLQYNSRR